MGSAKLHALLMIILMISGCGGMMNDLYPSGSDKRPPEQTGTVGAAVGQNSPDFTISDTLGNNVTLSSALTASQGFVLYFAMQACPVCEGHLDSLRYSLIPSFPNVRFYVVDYTCGSVTEARNWELSNGYAGAGFTVLADVTQSISILYNHATMGTTVVIDKNGVVRMNEEYKDDRLQTMLANLP